MIPSKNSRNAQRGWSLMDVTIRIVPNIKISGALKGL